MGRILAGTIGIAAILLAVVAIFGRETALEAIPIPPREGLDPPDALLGLEDASREAPARGSIAVEVEPLELATAARPMGGLRVTVVRAGTGGLVAGRSVRLHPAATHVGTLFESCTDDVGVAMFGGLGAGEVLVTATGAVPQVVLVAEGELASCRLSVAPGRRLRGRVSDAGGNAVAGAQVWSSDGIQCPYATAGEPTELALVSFRGRRTPPHTAAVEGRGLGRNRVDPSIVFARGTVVAVTDEQGEFDLSEVPEYRLVGARARGWQPSELQLVHPSSEEWIELRLAPGGSAVGGKVVGAGGSPVAGATVLVGDPYGGQPWRREAGIVVPAPRPLWLHTDGEGAFLAEGLAPGPTWVLAWSADHPFGATQVELAADGTAEVEVALPVGGVVSGIVRDAAGRAAAGARVELDLSGCTSSWVRADADGR